MSTEQNETKVCKCGSVVSQLPRNLARHEKTRKHQLYVASGGSSGDEAEVKGAVVNEPKPKEPKSPKAKKGKPSKTEGLYVSYSVDDAGFGVYLIVSDAGVVGRFSLPIKLPAKVPAAASPPSSE